MIALPIVAIVLSMPFYYQIAGILIGSVSVITWLGGAFQGDLGKLRISLFLTSLLFAISIAGQVLMDTLISAFPIQLFAFVLLLLNVEMAPLLAAHHKMHRNVSSSKDLARKSWKIMGRKISLLAVLFSACYTITIAIISLGTYIYALVPVLGDASIYLTVAFVVLALFVTLREGSTFDHEKYL